MKKLNFFMMCLLALSFSFVACDPKEDPNVDDIIEDGFYVVGEATGIANLQADGAAKATMAVGFNEVLQSAPGLTAEQKISAACQRAGMYEKYIYLEGGKAFSLVLKEGVTETKYGATLALSDTLRGENEPAIRVYKGIMTENTTMQVTESGLYHIVLDLNLNNDLANKLILVAPAKLGVRGGMNSWGFTALNATTVGDTITYVLENQELAAGGKFKFAYGGGWKIILDAEGLVKANTNLGAGLIPGATDFEVAQAGKYKITLKYALAQGNISASFKYTVELTEASALPTEMYMIGGDFGNWSWTDAGLVTLNPVNGVGGSFWCINYFTTAGFKFSSEKAWGKDFNGLTTNTGYTVVDGNCVVPAEGLYMVYIDFANNKIAIEPASVYGIGDAFGGWTEGVAANKFAVSTDGKKLTATVTAAGNLRMYAASSIKTTDWWTREFNVINGKIEYRGNGGDQAAVPVTAGKVVTLDFKAGTGTIE